KEIGLEDQFKWVETKTGFYANGKLFSMSNLLEFLRFPPINLFDKFRLGLTIFVASRLKNWKKLEKIKVETWLKRWSGKRVFTKIWLPLLKAKLGENYKNTSAAFIWATIQRMYAARKSGLKKEMFGYVSGGYNKINEAFASRLIEKGVEFRLNARVMNLTSSGNNLTIGLSNNSQYNFDRVISTLPSTISVQIAPGLNEEEKKKHLNIRYLGVVCPSVLLSKAISPYYVTNIIDDSTPFTGIIEMTAMIDKAETKGKHLVYLPKYVDPDNKWFDTTDSETGDFFVDSLLKMYPDLKNEDILYVGVSKARQVFALPTIDYSVNLPGIKTSIPYFYIINSAQIINGTLNVNETIQVAESKLKEIIND
ncbi:MAG: FAD-dependent oxidoreductase, partial [Bacteroidota bacterium]